MAAPSLPQDDPPADNQAFAAQMRPALVKYFTRKTGNSVEAEDLAQDVLVRALAHAHWTSVDQAKGYIFRAAINRWRDRRRRQQTHGTSVSWDDTTHAPESADNLPERVLIIREEFKQVLDALDSMNERTQAVLMLIRWEGMRAATVASMLGISESAVNKHLAKGLAQLAELRRKQEGS
jgi:RNA polymerase sigma-70 factor (ECF subfamily)